MYAVHLRDALEAGRRQNGKVRHKVIQLRFRRTNQKLMDEEILARHFVDDAEALRIGLVGTREAVEHKNFLVLQVCKHFCTDRIEFLSCNRHVDLAPRDIVMYGGGVDNEFIVRASARIFSRFHDKRPCVGERPLSSCQRLFHQCGNRKIAKHRSVSSNSKLNRFYLFHKSLHSTETGNRPAGCFIKIFDITCRKPR